MSDKPNATDLREMFMAANVQANEFARTGLANLILLNGGALLAMAPIGGMFNVRASAVFCLIVLCGLSFIAGLVCGVLGFLMGFLVNSRLGHIWQLQLADADHSTIVAHIDGHNVLRYWGIAFAIAGIVLFVCGCILGWAAIYNGAPGNPTVSTALD